MIRPTMYAAALAAACWAASSGAAAQPAGAEPSPNAPATSEATGPAEAAPEAGEGAPDASDEAEAGASTEQAGADSAPAAEPGPASEPAGATGDEPGADADGTAGADSAAAEPQGAAEATATELPRPGSFPPGGFKGWWTQQRTAPPRPVAAENWLKSGCVDCRVPFTGDRFRTRGPGAWFRRTAADWLAMPSTVITWGAPGWLTFGAFTAATVVPMLPLGPSLDVRLQDWINERKNERTDKAFLHISTKEIVSGVIVWEALILGAGWASGNERLLEYGGLTVEVLADVQFYHILAKLLLGREGPNQGDGQGKVYGPTEYFFPAGTPSGHTATIYALLTVSAEYADSWVLRAFSHVAALYFGMSLVYRNAHFVSDVIWGAAMGYYMGRWVMRYRSSRYRCDKPDSQRSLRERITWMPVVSRNGVALGASLSL